MYTITKGMSTVLGRRPKRSCENCGLTIPIYRGRYPKNCPHCGTSFVTEDSVVDSLISGDLDLDVVLEQDLFCGANDPEEKSVELDKLLQSVASMQLLDYLVGTQIAGNSQNIWLFFSPHIPDDKLKDFVEEVKLSAMDVQVYPAKEEGAKWVVSVLNPRVEDDPEFTGDLDANISLGGDIDVNQRIA